MSYAKREGHFPGSKPSHEVFGGERLSDYIFGFKDSFDYNEYNYGARRYVSDRPSYGAALIVDWEHPGGKRGSIFFGGAGYPDDQLVNVYVIGKGAVAMPMLQLRDLLPYGSFLRATSSK